MNSKSKELESKIEPVRSQLEAWRRSRKKGERIPEPLWQAMGELARAFGVGRMARVLGVGYHALKERAGGPGRPVETSAAVFVELPLSGAGPQSECVVELEDGRGAKMTLRLGLGSETQVLSMVQAFWGRER